MWGNASRPSTISPSDNEVVVVDPDSEIQCELLLLASVGIMGNMPRIPETMRSPTLVISVRSKGHYMIPGISV